MRRTIRLLILAVAVGVGLLASAAPATAHPLGNFTVNRYARIEVSAGMVRALYVLDLAEIPAFQERRAVAADPAGFARARAGEIGQGLELVVDGRRLPLALVDQTMELPPGQGGLTTLRLTALFDAELADGAAGQVHEAAFADTNQPERIGWREIVVIAREDADIVASDAPSNGISEELRSYPRDRLRSPLDARGATFTFTQGSTPADPPSLDASVGAIGGGGGFAALITRTDLTPLALTALLAAALGFGALHAVGPGHGKTVMAAYLVGARGRPRDAFFLGGIVSLMHTASVVVLGLILLRVDQSFATERAYPLLTLLSGVLVVGVGVWLLVGRWRRVRARRDEGNGHDHGGGHEHGAHGHSHTLPEAVAPLSWRGLVALGTSGGLFPSPSAVVVMVSAAALGRTALGLVLLATFSIGLAATLTAVGLAMVYGRDVIERRGYSGRLQLLPVLGALALVVLGVVISLRGIVQLG